MKIANKKEVKHFGYRCLGPTITPTKIKKLKQELKSSGKLSRAKKYFTILSGRTRLDILYLLRQEKELCVCDLADILKTTVSAVSHQLKILRVSGLVLTRKDAQTVFYSLSPEGQKELANHF